MISHRFTNTKTPNKDVDYMMFADDATKVEHYGNEHWVVNTDDLASVVYAGSSGFKAKLTAKLNDLSDFIDDNFAFGRDISDVIDDLIAEFNPNNIVDTAGAWDCPELIQKLYDNGLFDGIDAVETNDGVIVFNAGFVDKIKS